MAEHITNQKRVAELLSQGEKGTYPAGQGLELKITGPGRGSWTYRFQLKGKRKRKGLGPAAGSDALTIREAKRLRDEKSHQIADGIDPWEDAQFAEEKRREAERYAMTFEQVARQYIENHRAEWSNSKHAAQWQSTLAQYAFPYIGNKSPRDITNHDVAELLRRHWRDKTETMTRVRGRIESIMGAARAMGLYEGENPALWRGNLSTMLPAPSKIRKVKHHASLPWQAMPEFYAWLSGINSTPARALRFMILTALRTSEVIGARWDEIDGDTWIVPGERMKMGVEHRVPLSGEALAVLDKQPRIANSPYIFTGMSVGKHMSNNSMLKFLEYSGYRARHLSGQAKPEILSRYEVESITPHGMRSTIRDWAGEMTSYPFDVAERALAHTRKDKTERAYFRSDLFDRRRPLMEDWAEFVTSKMRA